MTRQRWQRLLCVVVVIIGTTAGVYLLLTTLHRHVELYQTPSQLDRQQHHTVMLGGLVKQGSVRHLESLWVQFVVTDYQRQISVRYHGVLPALFHEGQGVVMHGQVNHQGQFIASSVLAKHDQYYRPPGVTALPSGVSA